MQIDTKDIENGIIIGLNGKIIGDSVAELRQTIEDKLNSGVKWIILDLKEVPLMDSSALGTIIAAFMKLQEHNGQLVLLDPQKNIVDVLSITKLDSLFEVYYDIKTALEAVKS
ncbi:anti-sigma factor antagonist [Candidatus Poribacteria bacterium]|nr:anti-sigma factor antagonist [Candidatus Poribacteria bacterium]